MQLLTSVIVAASLLGASAQAETHPDVLTLGLLSLRSASPIHFGSINAANSKFWIWGPGPKEYCPPEVKGCQKTNSTLIDLYTDNGAAGLVRLIFVVSLRKTEANRFDDLVCQRPWWTGHLRCARRLALLHRASHWGRVPSRLHRVQRLHLHCMNSKISPFFYTVSNAIQNSLRLRKARSAFSGSRATAAPVSLPAPERVPIHGKFTSNCLARTTLRTVWALTLLLKVSKTPHCHGSSSRGWIFT
jgi:hypothetical protein